jgi:PAS domain S-box-containing protein
MKDSLNVLHVEDNEMDADLVARMLQSSGLNCKFTRVQNEDKFLQELDSPDIDIILCDHSMPQFDGMSALKLARARRPEIPFVFLSGTIGEESAIESLKQGASDYILKDRMNRLGPSLRRAIKDAADLSERNRMEAKIREQAALLDRARDSICLHDMAQKILFWNKGAERLYGWKSHEALGQNVQSLLFHENASFQAEALRNLIRKGEWQGELRQFTRNEKEIIVESRWTLLRNQYDEPQSVLVINTDITEKQRIEAQFLRTQRMETIGALAGGIAHDLNNALAPILVAIPMLRESATSPENARLFDIVIGSTKRCAEMVKQILTFSRGVAGSHQSLELEPLVIEASQFALKTFPRSIAIETVVPNDLPNVLGNSTQLHQVLLNLCVNARDAMPKGGKLRIQAESAVIDSPKTVSGQEIAPGRYVVLSVCDTGEGIPDGLREKIFEPFFTTKEAGKGTGLGLSTVMGIVKTHNGLVDMESQPGHGTTFRVYLPAVS